jgi:hypothetical protein
VQNTREFLGLWHSGHIFLSRGLVTDTGPPETLVRWSGKPANGMVRSLFLPASDRTRPGALTTRARQVWMESEPFAPRQLTVAM